MSAWDLAANETQQGYSMSPDCLDCLDCLDCDPMEMVEYPTCNNENCRSMSHACSPGSGIGLIPENPSNFYREILQFDGYLPAYSKFGSRSGDSI